MSVKVDPNLIKDLKHFGLKDAGNCFHCGNCTGVCPLSTPENPFPRKLVRWAQLGLKDKILHSSEPWLCYYCGECSDLCPRGADPGETMMVMRRYLTANYDWTGFSRKFYTSEIFELAAVLVVGLAVFFGLLAMAGPMDTTKVALNAVWPAHTIEILDLGMAAILTFFLLTNLWRAIGFIMGDDLKKIPVNIYIQQAKELLIHFITQKSFGKCEDRMQWWVHLLIMTGYSSVFLMVVVGIRWFQRDTVIVPAYSFLSYVMTLVGYYATAAILYGTTYAMIGRIKKEKRPYKNSHGTDWMFLILLQLTTITGILVHIFIYLGLPLATYYIYAIHLGVAVPMLVLEVPFAKWSHLAYRPVTIFLNKAREAWKAQGGGA